MSHTGVWISLLAFAGGSSLILLIFGRGRREDQEAKQRVRELARPGTRPPSRGSLPELILSVVPAVGLPLLPAGEKRRAELRARLIQAGIYDPRALPLFQGARVVLLALAAIITLSVAASGVLRAKYNFALGCTLLCLALVAPGLWIDSLRKRRQSALRRALPDAMDMLVLCVEGGVSLTGALQRVTAELQTAHPLLGAELNVVQGEMLMGLSAGEALEKFARRSGLEEVRSLASLLVQNERFGASVVKALRIHADALRQERHQRAEEMAQRAAVKILFPTLLCIFPAIFIVILGPAAYQIMAIFKK